MKAFLAPHLFAARLDPEVVCLVDEWRAGRPDLPSRTEAAGLLIRAGLESDSRIRLSDGERLIVRMLGDVFRRLGVESELKPDFIDEALAGGHGWALGWRHGDLFQRHEDSLHAVREVVDILDMWTFLEEGLEALAPSGRERVEARVAEAGGQRRFRGFDVRLESEHHQIARFLIVEMGRFSRFGDRADLVPSGPMLRSYRRMLGHFLAVRPTVVDRTMTGGELIRILAAG